MEDNTFAVFKDGENCSLSFQFQDGKVIIDEQACTAYRGALTYFSGELALGFSLISPEIKQSSYLAVFLCGALQ